MPTSIDLMSPVAILYLSATLSSVNDRPCLILLHCKMMDQQKAIMIGAIALAVLCLLSCCSSSVAAAYNPTSAAYSGGSASGTTAAATDTSAAAAAAATSPAITTAPIAYGTYANYDLEGTNVSNSATDPTTCAANCSASPSCTFHVTNAAGTQCWLKNQPTRFLSGKSDRIVHPRQRFPGLDLAGKDVSQLDTDAAGCAAACASNSGCAYAVMNGGGTHCWLKSTPDKFIANGDRTTIFH